MVEFALSGRGAELKEYLIAVEVYGHKPDYDPQAKSTVRVEASRLRSRLRDYYASSGREAAIRIEIPKGSYAPMFRPVRPEEPAARESSGTAETPVSTLPVVPPAASRRPRMKWILGAAIVAAGAAVAGWSVFGGKDRAASPVSAIAVLPFVNLAVAPEDERVCDGITEELTAALARKPGLRVTSRAAMAGLKGKAVDIRALAAEHRVDAFVEGSLRRDGARYLLTAQLIETKEGYHLWAETFDRSAKSPLDFEQQVAGEIASALEERVSGRVAWRHTGRPAPSSEARSLHLKAHDLLRQDPRRSAWPKGVPPQFLEAISLMERATQMEPDFAAGWSTLAQALLTSSEMDRPNERALVERARAAAQRAVRADPTLAEAHMILGEIGFYHVWDFAAAEAEFRRAIELNPRDAYAQAGYADVLRITGRSAQAKIEIARALTLEPNSANLRTQHALHLYDDGKCAEVVREADQALTMRPNLTMAYWIKGLCHESARDWAPAEREFKAALAIAPEDPRALPAIGHLYGLAGRREQASRVLAKLEALHSIGKPIAFSIALVHTATGKHDLAFEWLERGVREHDQSMPYAGVEQRFRPLRKDPRWKALLEKLRLEP